MQGCSITVLRVADKVDSINEICALLGYYAAFDGNSVPKFRDNPSVPSSRVKKSKKPGIANTN
jgi:hypothetical protein